MIIVVLIGAALLIHGRLVSTVMLIIGMVSVVIAVLMIIIAGRLICFTIGVKILFLL